MRGVVLGLLLAACSNDDAAVMVYAASPAMDAPLPLPAARCTSPAGSAAITATGEDFEAHYERMYAGGLIPGSADGGTPYSGLDMRLLFTNTALTQLSDLYGCYEAMDCESGGFLLESSLEEGSELGAHPAMFRSTKGPWSASGTITITAYDMPPGYLGHLAGSMSVSSSVSIEGTFDHSFCLDLISVTL